MFGDAAAKALAPILEGMADYFDLPDDEEASERRAKYRSKPCASCDGSGRCQACNGLGEWGEDGWEYYCTKCGGIGSENPDGKCMPRNAHCGDGRCRACNGRGY